MARSIETKENLKLIRSLIKNVTGFEIYEENFGVCEQFVVSNLKYHRFLDVDSHKVTRNLEGIIEKFRIHTEKKKAEKLKELSEHFLNSAIFEGKDTGKTDTHYAILSFLLQVSDSPVHSDYVETEISQPTEAGEQFDWGAYLLEGIESYHPGGIDSDLSDWSSDEEEQRDRTVEDRVHPLDHSSDGGHTSNHEMPQENIVPYHVTDGSTCKWEDSKEIEDSDWLEQNLISQYWRGEELNIETGRYRACQLNSDWEAYKQRVDPLQSKKSKTTVTENVLLREIVWMLMGISDVYLLEFNGRFFTPKPDVAVPTLTDEVLHEYLTLFTRYGSYVQILQSWVEDSYHDASMCQTYQAFALSLADFLQKMKAELVAIEKRLIQQDEVLTLISVWQQLQPLLQKVAILCMVYMRGVHHGRALKLASQRATLLLSTLYDILLGFDTQFELPILEREGADGETSVAREEKEGESLKLRCEPVDMTRLLLPIWIQTCQPFINIIDTWISQGYLSDPCREFVIQRNKNIKTLDETFWDKSFTFHTMLINDDDEDGDDNDDETRSPSRAKSRNKKKLQEYKTDSWVPKFLKPVLQEVMLTGKSMEMLEGLGKLVEEHEGTISMERLNDFRETHLYDRFLASLKTSLGIKDEKKDSEEHLREATPDTNPRVFSPDIEAQMKERGLHDDFLKMHFQNMMNQKSESHTLLEKSFTDAVENLELDSLQPLEMLLRQCLYPHIHWQYKRVCKQLVETMKSEYHLMEYLQAMRSFFLMEAGDALSVFCSEIFDKIRLHEHWKDTGTVTWALHEALDAHFPDEVPRIAVVVEQADEASGDFQAVNITNCLKLQYQIPSPVDVVINERCQQIYNQIFSFLLQIKHAKYCLDELRFHELAKETVPVDNVDRLFRSLNQDTTPRASKIHHMHLLRMKMINFINSLHNYMMTRILHSVGLEFTRDLSHATDLDQIVEIHSSYIRKIHERCLLHKKNEFLRATVVKVLSLALRFQKEWDSGIDNISMKQIQETETEFHRCLQFLTSFLKSVLQRRSFPHLESLAFSLETLINR